jgi:membrane-associated tyrosine- and threonine-specific cdc2-inhibitory kinase
MEGNYSLANDIFSLGITLLELACGLELPANGKLWQDLRSLILPEEAMNLLSSDLQKIIRSMMEPDPSKRPTVHQLLKHPRLKSLVKQRTVSKVFTRSVCYLCAGY